MTGEILMEQTNVMVKFVITGEEFSHSEITSELQVNPTSFWTKGDCIIGKKMKRIETSWILATGYEHSYDINEQLFKIVNILLDKKFILKKMKEKYSIDYIFSIVVNVENNENPTIYFNRDFIQFANDIEAEFYVDLYVFS